ncbi:hypothetical protein TELCIR_14510 [Teladorsagia circumcincta]|uniref:FERM N-terminal domain-containing protein n=1 Tax=Teladorsagia circumcincta TaxID=45464 RepID=A0A2G9U0Y6_TELCI|nr:hypothetical protein TELCIR_14510 [Teladorsagia circumcincta]
MSGDVSSICTSQRHAHGSVLLDKVFAHLELVERDFFGLQFLYVLGTKETQKSVLPPASSNK